MKFKATKIATAVAAGLGLSMVGMNAAKADSILFPHIVLSDTVTTILSVINDDFEALDALHYRYYYKQGTVAGGEIRAPSNDAECREFDFWNDTSANDVVSFDMANYITSEDGDSPDPVGVLFEPNRSAVNYQDDFAILGKLPQPDGVPEGRRLPIRGYVLVENTPFNPADPLPAPTAKLAGEAIIIEHGTGSAWGYQAYNASEIWGFTVEDDIGTLRLLNPNDFSDRVEVNGEVLATPPADTSASDQKNNFWVPMAVMPWNAVSSALLVTAVSEDMGPNGNYTTQTSLRLRGTATGADRIMFDRDERAYSGPGNATVRCVGRVAISDMVGQAVQQSTPEGGWSNLTVTNGQAIVFKAEINTELPVASGTFNNIYQLRKGYRETLGRVVDAGAGWTELPSFAIPGLDANATFAVFEGDQIPAEVYESANYADPDEVRIAVEQGRVFVKSSAQ